MSDYYSKIEADRNPLQKLAASIPGFGGYFRAEDRREADRLMREEVARRYGEQLRRLNDVPSALLEAGQISLLDDVDKARTRLQTFIDRVRTASYGYSGLMAAAEVNEEDLIEVYNFDNGLLEGTSRLSSAIDAVTGAETSASIIGALITTIDDLNNTFSQREAVLHG